MVVALIVKLKEETRKRGEENKNYKCMVINSVEK